MNEDNDLPHVSLRVYGCPVSVVMDKFLKEMMSDWAFRKLLTPKLYRSVEAIESEAIVIVEPGVDSVSCTKKDFNALWSSLKTRVIIPTPLTLSKPTKEKPMKPTQPDVIEVEEAPVDTHGFMQPLSLADIEFIQVASAEGKFIEFAESVVKTDKRRLLAIAFYLNEGKFGAHSHTAYLMLKFVAYLLVNQSELTSPHEVKLVRALLDNNDEDSLTNMLNDTLDRLAEFDYVKSQELSIPHIYTGKMCAQALRYLKETKEKKDV